MVNGAVVPKADSPWRTRIEIFKNLLNICGKGDIIEKIEVNILKKCENKHKRLNDKIRILFTADIFNYLHHKPLGSASAFL